MVSTAQCRGTTFIPFFLPFPSLLLTAQVTKTLRADSTNLGRLLWKLTTGPRTRSLRSLRQLGPPLRGSCNLPEQTEPGWFRMPGSPRKVMCPN
jgi:hypothetical protein